MVSVLAMVWGCGVVLCALAGIAANVLLYFIWRRLGERCVERVYDPGRDYKRSVLPPVVNGNPFSYSGADK